MESETELISASRLYRGRYVKFRFYLSISNTDNNIEFFDGTVYLNANTKKSISNAKRTFAKLRLGDAFLNIYRPAILYNLTIFVSVDNSRYSLKPFIPI